MNQTDIIIENIEAQIKILEEQIAGLKILKKLDPAVLSGFVKAFQSIDPNSKKSLHNGVKKATEIIKDYGGNTGVLKSIIRAHPDGIHKSDIRPLYAQKKGYDENDARVESEVTNGLSSLRNSKQVKSIKPTGHIGKGGLWVLMEKTT